MKQIILGYARKDGSGSPVIVAGLDVPYIEQQKILDAADRQHVFPEGIERLERCNLKVTSTSVFISAEVTAHLKTIAKEAALLLKKKTEAKATETAQQKAIKETGEALRKAVIYRNNLLGDKHQADVKLRNLLATPLELCGKNHQANTEAAQKSVDELAAKVAEAVTAFQAAEKAHDEAKNPKPITPNATGGSPE